MPSPIDPFPLILMQPGMAKMKVTRPSDIQASVIPEILSTDNVALQSYTGSGKVRHGTCVLSISLRSIQSYFPFHLADSGLPTARNDPCNRPR